MEKNSRKRNGKIPVGRKVNTGKGFVFGIEIVKQIKNKRMSGKKKLAIIGTVGLPAQYGG